jgi:tRNA A-37 threonylcarbamoyl transferase component Bud32
LTGFTFHQPGRAADVERWSRGEVNGDVIKENGARVVWRVPSGSPALYIKRFPPEFFRDRARKEATMLLALEGAGIPCPRLVATGKDVSGTYVITEEIADAPILKEVLERGGPSTKGLATALGTLVRRLLDSGFEHQDLHVGNILVRDRTLYVMDVHRARRSSRLPRSRRMGTIAFTAMSFLELRPLTDVARFLNGAGLRRHEEWETVWDLLRRALHRYYAGREKRCVEGGRGFGRRGRIYHRTGTDLEKVLSWVRTGPKIPIKVEGSRGLWRSGDGLFLKEMRRGRAVRYWRNAHGLAVRNVGTPRLLAASDTWVAGDWIDSEDLYTFVSTRFGALGRAGRDRFLERLARDVRRLHHTGVFHGDLKATNVLVGESACLFADLDRIRFRLEVRREDRIFNLAQLNASLAPPLTRTDRLRFLRAYFGRCASLRKEERRWVRDIMRISVERRHRWPPTGRG